MIGEYFQQAYAEEFYTIIIKTLFSLNDTFIPDAVVLFYIKYLTQSIKFPQIFQKMTKEVISNIFINIAFPLIYRTQKEEMMFKEDPIGFIRQEEEITTTYHSKKNSALLLIISLCERGFLPSVFNFIRGVLRTSPDPVKKEAMLNVLGSVSNLLEANLQLKTSIEDLLFESVFPYLTSSIEMFRARAV